MNITGSSGLMVYLWVQ